MSDHEAAARATLGRLSIEPEEPAEDRLATAMAGPEAAALVEALAELATPAAAALLVRLEPHAAGRATRKDIRRALYRLRQRGVPVPDPPPTPAPHRAAGEEPEAFLTGFAGDGDRILWLVKPLTEGGSLVVYAHLHEPRGLLDLTVGEVGRKKLREVRQRLESDSALRLVPVDWRVADALVVEAQERSGDDDPKRNYRRVRSRITAEAPRPPAEPVSARVSPPAADETEALVAGSAALLAEPEFRTWHPPLDQAAPVVEELEATRESPLVLSRGAQEDRVRDVIRRAVTTLAPAATLARRLEGTAYTLAETGREPLARQALAVAAALCARPGSAGEVPFVVAFVERVLGQLLAADTARRDDEQRGALVVTPGQFLKDRASSRPTHTRG